MRTARTQEPEPDVGVALHNGQEAVGVTIPQKHIVINTISVGTCVPKNQSRMFGWRSAMRRKAAGSPSLRHTLLKLL